MSGGTRISDARREIPAAGTGARRTGAGTPSSAKESAGKVPAASALPASPKALPLSPKNNSVVSNSPPPNASPQNSLLQNPGLQKTGEFPVRQNIPALEIFRQSAADLGFPRDFLSSAILAFARFFSLAPDAALLGKLRRELLAPLKSSPSENAAASAEEKAAPEAKILAAAAAFDKGVVLGPEALERYARFFVLPARAEGGQNADYRPADHDSAEENPGEEAPDAEKLRALASATASASAGEEAAKDGLLDFLNLLPGKNGQYWQVFPFKITVRGIELAVFIRLLKRGPFAAGEAEKVIADVSGPTKAWRFFLEKKAGKIRADIRVHPELSPRKLGALRKEAERFFGKTTGTARGFAGFEEVLVRNGGAFSWLDDLFAQVLPSVDKEV